MLTTTGFLAALAERWTVLGHGHPRILDQLMPVYEELGIEPAYTFEEVLDRASVYCCDNSSTLFEFASLDRPVVVLNPPWYRREVEHGLRFWEAATVGVQVGDQPLDIGLRLDGPGVGSRSRLAERGPAIAGGAWSVECRNITFGCGRFRVDALEHGLQ